MSLLLRHLLLNNNMKQILFIIALTILSISLFAQNYLPDSLKSKYHMLTWEELDNSSRMNSKDITPTSAPTGTVRSIAEWERNQGVIVAYPSQGFGIPIDLIRMLSEDVHVYIIYGQSSALSTIQNELESGNVDMENVSFELIPSDTYWTRDFSPWFISYNNNTQIGIVNFDYNRNRPDDNNVPVEFGELLDLEVFGMEVEHTGGNYMSDGMYKAASTNLVYTENEGWMSYNIDEDEVNARMESFLGITDYIVVEDPMDDYIYHIDCWAKFLDVDKILVGEVSPSDYRYEDYEAAADYFSNQISSYGNNYQVFRAYSPDGQPYTNSLIMNNKVYVPVPTGTGSEWNDEAIAIYQEAMPGYEIIAVPNTTAPEWQSTDALHCRTHEVPDTEMLNIFHSALYGTQPDLDEYIINADITSYGDNALIIDSLRVYYSVNNSSWNYLNMTNTSGNTYTAAIPSQIPGDEIAYFIHAADITGRSENHPFIGSADPHKFTIEDASMVNNGNIIHVSAFPNPARENLNIALHHFDNCAAQIDIFDINGKHIKQIPINYADNYTLIKINIADFPTGAYTIRVISQQSAPYMTKFIKL
jgi:agmatine deiminase